MTRFSDIQIDADTVSAAQRGEPAALERIYVSCSAAVYTLIRRLVRRPAVAEDLLQETFADVIQHIGSFEGRAPLQMWGFDSPSRHQPDQARGAALQRVAWPRVATFPARQASKQADDPIQRHPDRRRHRFGSPEG